MFAKLSLRLKIMLGYGLVVLIAALIGIVGWVGMSRLGKEIHTLGEVSIPSIVHIETIVVRMERIKVAIRTLCSPYLSKEDIERQFTNIEKARADYQAALEAYKVMTRTPEEEALYQAFLSKLDRSRKENNSIIEDAKKLLELPEGNERTRLIQEMNQRALSGSNSEAFDSMMAAAVELLEYIKNFYGKEKVKQSMGLSNMLIMVIQGALVVGVVLALGLGLLITSSISRPMNKSTRELTLSSDNLEGAANQIASASQELSSGASELASSVEEITSSMEELQSIIESNTKSVNEAELLMKETASAAAASSSRTEELLTMMQEISENSRKVVKINKVIDDIAFQTSILALNAAVEAARAGEAGRGFAVVADQVTALAQKSAEASSETSELIETVVSNIERGTQRTQEVTVDVKKVSEAANKVNILLDEINRAFKEQSKGASQVTKAISQVNTVVQQTAASSEETASAGEELLSQVEQLRSIVSTLNRITNGDKKQQKEEGTTDVVQGRSEKKSVSRIVGTSRSSQRSTAMHNLTRTIHDELGTVHHEVAHGSGNGKETEEVERISPDKVIPLEDFKDF
ncbi:MAG: methyl-accepting chemotaxis protein [Treponemataceae bacterium]|nr:methyl-accepting chemotaxis protein [Treponemataceae bacterium]